MSDLEKFKQSPIKELHQKTFIAPKIIEALQNEDFSKIQNRSKALAFIAIIEREMEWELEELKERAKEFYAQKEPPKPKEELPIEDKKSLYPWLIVGVALLVGVIFLLWPKKEQKEPLSKPFLELNETNLSSNEENETEDNSTIVIVENNISTETNVTQEANESIEEPAEPPLPTVTIIPKSKLWVGIIYLDNYKRKVYVTTAPIEINSSRDQLILAAHSNFNVDIDGKEEHFNKRGRVYLLYRAGELEEIDAKTFRRYNRGKIW